MPTPISSLPRYMRYRIRRYREGCCINCGEKREPKPLGRYKSYCNGCGEHRRKLEKKRRVKQFHQWKPGGRGRPPLNAAQIIERKAKKLRKKAQSGPERDFEAEGLASVISEPKFGDE